MVHVDDVPRGKQSGAICPACGITLVARQGQIRVHHFAHGDDNSDGACEGWLHKTAKRLLYDRIRSALDDGRRIPIRWRCQERTCRCGVHEGDLLKHVDDVKLETPIAGPNIKPDLCLYKQGAPYKLIEIVVTSDPKAPTRDYAQEAGVLLLEFSLSRASDIDSVILGPILEPSATNLEAKHCPCPTCPHCKNWRTCDKAHHYCPRCNSCAREIHRYCRMCDSCVTGRNHWYCQKCGSCATGSHRHCVSCGDAMSWTEGKYPKHYCCYFTDMFRLPRCSDRVGPDVKTETHGHCIKCGARTGFSRIREFDPPYDTCYRCHRESQLRAREEWERRQGERQAKDRQEEEQWRDFNEWFQRRQRETRR